MKTNTTTEPQGQSTALRCDALVRLLRERTCGEVSCEECNAQRVAAADEIESMRADMNDACITLNSAIEDCDDYAMMHTQQKLTAVRDVLLSYLPNTGYEPRDCGEKLKP